MNQAQSRVAGWSGSSSLPWAPLFLLLTCAVPRVSAQSLTLSATLELSQVYLPQRWQPVRLEFRNETDLAIDGSAQLPLSDATAPAVMRLPISVPAHSRVTATMWAYFPRTIQTAQQKKQGQMPPLGVAEWRGADGAMLSRAPVLGFPLTQTSAEEGDQEPGGEMILVVNEHPDQTSEVDDAASLVNHLKESTSAPLATCIIGPEAISHEPYGLQPLKAIVFQGVDPEAFDMAQREALVSYVRGGGVIVMAAPDEMVARMGTWLAPMLPMRVIGSRLAERIEASSKEGMVKFSAPVPIAEAVEAGAYSLLRDRDYVHIACKPLGLGSVVFTSFPINALDPSQPQATSLWQQVLKLNQSDNDWNETQLGNVRQDILAAMIGAKVPPWSIAAAVVGGYLVLLVAIQFACPGASRPKAFLASIAAAVLLSGVLVAMGSGRRANQSLQSARLAVLDVSGDGGGWKRESFAYVGPGGSDISIAATDGRAMIRPALADQNNRPTILQQPFRVDNAGVLTERIDRIWEQQGPLDEHQRLQVVGRFGPDGLTLDVDNGLGKPLRSPLVMFGRRALTLADLPPGKSTVQPLRVNDREDFTNATMLTSDLAKRRGQVVRASLTSSSENNHSLTPLLIGWLDEPGAMVMARTRLQIQPAQRGTALKIPSAMIAVDTGRLPYDTQKSETVPSTESGQWLVSFCAPVSLGPVRPTHVTFEARVTLPQQTLVVRKNRGAGDAVAEWNHEIGSKQVSFYCTPEDYDHDGHVFLSLEIRRDDSVTTGTPVPWQIKDLGMSFDDAQAAGSESQEKH